MASNWHERIDALTPWEPRRGVWFKREDYFAPLGYGGPNGSKMRQLIWYISKHHTGKTHIVTGASIQSPQLSMTAIVGHHYGLKSRMVVYSKPETVLKHENPRIASWFGAEFIYAAGPYNPIIQRKVHDITTRKSLVVEYGITITQDAYEHQIRQFHEVGARQTINTPATIKRLIVPAGSCNTLCSILLGLSKNSHNLSQLFTIGIGPDKREWVKNRMQHIGVDTAKLPFQWRHHSLHDTGYSTYSEKFTGEGYTDIEFHPTYEAKIWRWLRTHEPLNMDYRTGFWIVGSAPNPEVIKPFATAPAKRHA